MQSLTPIIKGSRLDLIDLIPKSHSGEFFHAWGYEDGSIASQSLSIALMSQPEIDVFTISCAGVNFFDAVFPRIAVLSVFSSKAGRQGFVFSDLQNREQLENLEAASLHQGLAVNIIRAGSFAEKANLNHANQFGDSWILGKTNTDRMALQCVLKSGGCFSADVADALSIQKNNASNILKRLSDRGFLLRKEVPAQTGGIVHFYYSPTSFAKA